MIVIETSRKEKNPETDKNGNSIRKQKLCNVIATLMRRNKNWSFAKMKLQSAHFSAASLYFIRDV